MLLGTVLTYKMTIRFSEILKSKKKCKLKKKKAIIVNYLFLLPVITFFTLYSVFFHFFFFSFISNTNKVELFIKAVVFRIQLLAILLCLMNFWYWKTGNLVTYYLKNKKKIFLHIFFFLLIFLKKHLWLNILNCF